VSEDPFKLDIKQLGKDVANLLCNEAVSKGASYELRSNEETNVHDPKMATFDLVLTDQCIRVRIESV
jgi:hypothetical protein